MHLSISLLILLIAVRNGLTLNNGSESEYDPVQLRVVGGYDTTIQYYPYVISLKYDGKPRCGGALISQSHVLTAAHCLVRYIPGGSLYGQMHRLSVDLGSSYLRYGGVRRYIESVHPHPLYDSTRLTNDIGIIKLRDVVQFSSEIQPVPLPTVSDVPAGSSVWLVGFGTTRQGDPITQRDPASNSLKTASVTVVDRTACAYSWEKVLSITSGHLCTSTSGGIGTCVGDSGGPMLYNGQVVGIVSFGHRLCAAGYPDVGTNVGQHLDFIRQYTAQ